MTHKQRTTGLFFFLAIFSCFSQNLKPVSALKVLKSTPVFAISQPDRMKLQQEDAQNDRNGELFRIGIGTQTFISPSTAGTWTTLENGDKTWQLRISAPNAEALSFLFSRFKISGAATMDVFSPSGKQLHKTLTSADVLEHFQQNMSLCYGDEMILQLVEPAGTPASEIQLEHIVYGYRSTGNPDAAAINESNACHVNVNCSPEGDLWQDEKRGIARILTINSIAGGGVSQSWANGSLVNNAALDCKPLFLTAFHCGLNATASNFNQWVFYFRYEAPGCSNPLDEGTLADHYLTGCFKLADSHDNGGDTGSDFLLLQLGTSGTEASIISQLKAPELNAYWNGWDANNVTGETGSGIHHPHGDIKKISVYNGSRISTQWLTNGLPSHWKISWSAGPNGYGVTQDGSSGSPLFSLNGGNSLIVGTLTGGTSGCTASTQNSPDYYGKMSYHWTMNGTTPDSQLKAFLDPGNTGILILNGSNNPCGAAVSPVPVAQFNASQTTFTAGGTVNFTDLSAYNPTSWTWSVTPGGGWSFAAGSTAASQHPQILFTTPGLYTISLTATNGQGSDAETKTNFIHVVSASDPCIATSELCDEFLSNVSLSNLINSSGCGNYTHYSTPINLHQGYQYTLSFTTRIGVADPGNPGAAYDGDEIAAWIDWNGDADFSDAGERVGYSMKSGSNPNWSDPFIFTPPVTSVLGDVAMRIRISYQPQDGNIDPCGTTANGEVEDYVVHIDGPLGIHEATALAAVTVFPNPVTNDLSVDLSALKNEPVTLTVTDLSGKVILIKEQTGSIAHIDFSGLAKGVYQLVIHAGEGTKTQRIVRL